MYKLVLWCMLALTSPSSLLLRTACSTRLHVWSCSLFNWACATHTMKGQQREQVLLYISECIQQVLLHVIQYTLAL
jgi:hypothetical protein